MGRPLNHGALVALALLAGACGPGATDTVGLASPFGGGGGAVQARSGTGATTFVQRIDGDVTTLYRAAVTTDEPQVVVVTGRGGGNEQASLLLLSEFGELMARYRASGDVPPMRPGQERQYRFLCPVSQRVVVADYGDRRFVLTATAGAWVPYAVEVLEAEDARTLTPRYRFWNAGATFTPVVDHTSGLMAAKCVNNSFDRDPTDDQRYLSALFVLSLDRAMEGAESGEVVEGVCPLAESVNDDGSVRHPESIGHGYVRYYLLPEYGGTWHRTDFTVTIDGHTVRARESSGLTYVMHVDTDEIEIEADADVRTRHAEQRTADPALPEFDVWLEARRRSIRVFRPDDE